MKVLRSFTAPRLISACLLLLVSSLASSLPSCSSIAPAKPEFVDRLERPVSREAQKQLERAEQDLADGRWKQALEGLGRLCPENPGCARIAILARRAVSLAPEAEREGLLQMLRSKLTKEQEGASDRVALASLSFAQALLAGSVREQERWLRRAIKYEPKHYYALCKLGELLWRRGDLESARKRLSAAVSLRRDLPEGWLVLAQVAEDRGLYRKAAKYYDSYLGLRPKDRRVQLNAARLLVQQLRDGARAEKILLPMRRDDPSNLEVALDLGLALFLQKRYREAEHLYLELLRRWPREVRVLLSLGNLYHGALAQERKALQVYRWLLVQRSSSDPLAMLGQALFVPARVRQIEEALSKRGERLPSPPTSVDALFSLRAAGAAAGLQTSGT